MSHYLHRMKRILFLFLSALAYFFSSAQSDLIKEVFRLIPADKIYNLTPATRDSMLQGKTYYPEDNDSNEILAYNYGTSTNVTDYMYVSLSFETGQRATGMIEIRSFKMINGDNLILVSATGGVWPIAYGQRDLSVFIYGKDKKLDPYKKKIIPATGEKTFMRRGIPDSVRKEILNNSNMTFDLNDEKLTLGLNSYHISENKTLRKWLKGDRIYFDWVKDHFVMSKLEFE